MSDTRRVIGIFTTQGGTGKTTIALNLASALRERGKSALVEMDTNFSLSALLKVEAVKVADVFEGKRSITEVHGIGVVSSDGRTKRYEDKVNPQILNNLWESLSPYEYLVFDFHNSQSPLVLALLQKADMVLIPAVPSAAGLGAYIHTKKIVEKIDVRHVGVANMVHKTLFGVVKEEREIMEKMRQKGNFWDGFIPYDRSVVRAEAVHAPAVSAYPNSPFSKAVKKLAKEVI